MFRNDYDMLLTKYAADAEKEIEEKNLNIANHKLEKAQRELFYNLFKIFLLCLAVGGVCTGIYYARDLGSIAAEVTTKEPDPSLIAQPSSTKAKVQRKMAEIRKQQEADLDEIQGAGSQDNGSDYKLPTEVQGKGQLSGMRAKQIKAMDDIEGGDSRAK